LFPLSFPNFYLKGGRRSKKVEPEYTSELDISFFLSLILDNLHSSKILFIFPLMGMFSSLLILSALEPLIDREVKISDKERKGETNQYIHKFFLLFLYIEIPI
jgi:hypothetical protein